jgi:PilZ domain
VAGEQRKYRRVPSYAKAILVEGQVPGYIRDLSAGGCQVMFLQPVRAAVGDLVTVRVIAEHDPTIAPFQVRLRVRRLIDDPPWYSLGTEIEGKVGPGEESAFQALVGYYSGAEA